MIYNYIEKLYKNGGKNIMIMNLAPYHLAPINNNNKHQYYENEIPYFNSVLNKKAKILYEKYNDINIFIYNTNSKYIDIIKNYKKYNFISVKETWVSHKNKNPDDYFWYNSRHITKKGNEIISNDINEFLKSLI